MVRAGRQSRVGLTPVYAGWEAVLGATPGKECRRQGVLTGFWSWCALVPAPPHKWARWWQGRASLEWLVILKGALCLSCCNVYTDPSPKTPP